MQQARKELAAMANKMVLNPIHNTPDKVEAECSRLEMQLAKIRCDMKERNHPDTLQQDADRQVESDGTNDRNASDAGSKRDKKGKKGKEEIPKADSE